MAPVTLPQTQTPYADFRLRAAWRNNVFVERFWRTVKYEEVYLKAYEGAAEDG